MVDNPAAHLHWSAYLEFTQNKTLDELTWDKISLVIPASDKVIIQSSNIYVINWYLGVILSFNIEYAFIGTLLMYILRIYTIQLKIYILDLQLAISLSVSWENKTTIKVHLPLYKNCTCEYTLHMIHLLH